MPDLRGPSTSSAPAGAAPAGGPSGEIKNGAIVAWKVVDQNGAPALQPVDLGGVVHRGQHLMLEPHRHLCRQGLTNG